MLFKVLSFYLYKEIMCTEVIKKNNKKFIKNTLELQHNWEDNIKQNQFIRVATDQAEKIYFSKSNFYVKLVLK